MRTKITLLSIIMAAGTMAVQAAQPWTLDRCVSYAVANSPSVDISKARSDIYRQNQKESVANLFPSVSASASGRFAFGRGEGDDGLYVNETAFNNSFGVGGSLTLFDGLASIYRVKMNKAGKLMGLQNLQKAKDDVAFNTMELFFLAQGYAEMVDFCREQVTATQSNLEQTERMAEVGIKAYPDVAEIRAQAAAAQYNLTRQENLYRITIIKLKEQMNFPVDEELEITPYDAAERVSRTSDSPMEIYAFASGYNPSAISARRSEEYSLYNYRAVRGTLYPSLYVDAGINTGFYRSTRHAYYPYWDQLKDKRGEYISIGMSIPVFGGLSRSSNVKRAKLNYQIARNETEQTLRALYSEIEQTIADVNGQADEFTQLRLQTDAAELAYQLNLRKYNEGLINAIELHTSSNRLLQSKAELTSSGLMYLLKSRLLDYYKGIPLYTE